MSKRETRLNGNTLPWLLEADSANPGVRYFALRNLLDYAPDDPEVVAAQEAVMNCGPVPIIMEAQTPEGYWVQPKPIYIPSYRGTGWQVLFLAQLGCDGRHPRVRQAIDHVFVHTYTKFDTLSHTGPPSGTIHCTWGNMIRALFDLGYGDDARLSRAVDMLARSITGDGYDHYYKSGIQASGFACAANNGLPCAWGAIRALWAFNRVPVAARTAPVQAAIEACIDFLLRYDIARADYPHAERINSSWFKFGYPHGYITDLLLNLEVLTEAGVVDDSRLEDAVALVLAKQDEQGRWPLEYSYNGKMWVDVEKKGNPSKWVTLRALRVLKRLEIVPAEWFTTANE